MLTNYEAKFAKMDKSACIFATSKKILIKCKNQD